MIRRFFPYVLVAVVVAQVAAFALPPKPKVADTAFTVTLAPDSTIHAAMVVTLSGPLQAPDAIRYTVYRNDSLQADVSSTVTDTTFMLGAPAYGQTAVYKGCGRVFRGTSPSGGFKCASLSYTRPEAPLPPPPVVDSVIVRPASATLQPGGSQQFCAFCRLTDLRWVMCGPQAGQRAYCDEQFAQYLTERAA